MGEKLDWTAAPGVSGAQFEYLDNNLQLDNAGRVAFKSTLFDSNPAKNGTNRVWFGAPGALKMIVRQGDPAPGTPAGVVFGNHFDFEINNTGQLAIYASLDSTGVTAINGTPLFAADLAGDLNLILRPGDPFVVSEGGVNVTKTVQYFSLMLNSNPAAGDVRSLADDGSLPLHIVFTDGSDGIFETQLPEPGSIALLGTALLCLLSRRARPRSGNQPK